MNRVKISKVKYITILIILIVISLLVGIKVFKDNIIFVLLLISLIALIPGRIQGVFYRDFFIGRKLMTQDNLKESLKHFEKFLLDIRKKEWKKKLMWLSWGMYSTDIEAMTLNNIGTIYLKLGNWKAAQENYDSAIKVDSKYPIPFYNLALLFSVLGDNDKSIEYLKQSKDLGFKNTSTDKLIQKGQELLSFIEGRKK